MPGYSYSSSFCDMFTPFQLSVYSNSKTLEGVTLFNFSLYVCVGGFLLFEMQTALHLLMLKVSCHFWVQVYNLERSSCKVKQSAVFEI